MGIEVGHHKRAIKKKEGVIQIGSPSQVTEVQGQLDVTGPVKVNSPMLAPDFIAGQRMKVFALGPDGIGWQSVNPQTVSILDALAGTDNFYVQSTRGFAKNSYWVLNPGAANMESGKVTYKLESKMFISGSGSNDGLYYDHSKGERVINLSYVL